MTKQVALILTATDELFAKTFEIGESYEMLRNGVGGWIELVRLNNGVDMWVNEDGIAENLPYNATATAIYWSNFGFMSGTIFGDVVFTNSNDEGDTTGLTIPQFEYLSEIAFDILGLKIKTLA
jgi:hypothetical protein